MSAGRYYFFTLTVPFMFNFEERKMSKTLSGSHFKESPHLFSSVHLLIRAKSDREGKNTQTHSNTQKNYNKKM